MALVIIATTTPLTPTQQERINTVVSATLKGEGITTTQASFLLIESETIPETVTLNAEGTPTAETTEDFKAKTRRSRQELEDLKQKLIDLLHTKGSLSSFEAQDKLGLSECDWAPATLRRLFGQMEDEKIITKSGQKRGTRYFMVKEEAPVLSH
jgi:hypothetical protein